MTTAATRASPSQMICQAPLPSRSQPPLMVRPDTRPSFSMYVPFSTYTVVRAFFVAQSMPCFTVGQGD
jgi:hypothetical protein